MNAWQEYANCTPVDASLFFARDGEKPSQRKIRQRVAQGICAVCVVKVECGQYARDMNISYGIWGGKTEKERNRGDVELGCRHCSKRFIWSWAPHGKPWYCSDSCRRAAQKVAHRLRNKRYQEISA